MLDKDGKEVGRIEGRFVLTRQANTRSPVLSDTALKDVATEPNADNTRLLYDNRELGVRFLYPRRWHVASVRGSQVTLDSADGSGLLVTLDPLTRAPTGAAFPGRIARLARQAAGAFVACRIAAYAAPRRFSSILP